MDFFFGSDGFGYFVWTTDNGYFDVNYVINASSVSNENSRIQNGGHYIDSTMFCLQLCLLLSPFLSHAFRYLTTTISHFKRMKTQSHSDYEIFKFETKAGTSSKSILGSSDENKCLVRQSIGRNGHCARQSYNNIQKCREITSQALFAHTY